MHASPSEHTLSPDVAEVFARGLYYLASIDGIDARETHLIREFLTEANLALTIDDLATAGFSPTEAAYVLGTSWMRRTFLRAAVALVRADGTYSDAERHAIGQIADAFGLSNAEFGDIEQQARSISLENVS